MNNKNIREELFKSIWKCAEDLRNKIDSYGFKNYILGFLFYRFISENITNYFNDQIEDYSKLSDDVIKEELISETIDEKGFFIYPSELFINVLNKSKKDVCDLNIILSKIFNDIQKRSVNNEKANNSIKGLFNVIDLNSKNIIASDDLLTKNKYLLKIMENIQNFQLNDFQNNDYDIFGDAYEFLIRMYASKAGKSGGEFFTPQSVSKLLALLSLNSNNSTTLDIYDPACGSGSLLLSVSKFIDKKMYIRYFGQESEPSTYNLCRMNMFLHNVSYDNFDIQNDDTLINPLHLNKKFDIVLSNPPYSIKWEGSKNTNLLDDERFIEAGALAPNSKADFAFIQHSLYHLKENGTAAVVCFPGIFYRNGTEYTIRKWMVESGFVKAIIKLPIDLFYGTSISTNILVLSKNDNPYIKFINAEDLFDRYESKNYLTDENITQILDLFKSSTNVANYLHIAPLQEVMDNNYNLSVENYVKKEVAKEVIDIKVLNEEIKNISLRNNTLRNKINKIIEELENE